MLPARPRLRVSFWYEGDAAKCELVLMGERRELVHRETLDVAPGTGLERVHAGLLSAAGTLARAAQGGVVATEELRAMAPAPTPAPVMSSEELALERERRANLQTMGWAPEVLRELPPEARANTVIENHGKPRESEPES